MAISQIGRYSTERELGRGGMATVYLAHDPVLDRKVAIKLISPEFLSNEMLRERFQREARAITRLGHSAIVPVFDFGDHQGQPYLVMGYMSGGSLSQRMKEARLSDDEALRITTRIAAALDAAHSAGLIHRDVKPDNILFDQYGDAFLSDFGIVKLGDGATQLTGSMVMGTPAYMAPEMADTSDVTPAADLYALGVTLFQILAGQTPYQATTPLGQMMAHVSKPIPNIRDLRPDLPEAVQQVIEKALAKEPAARFESGEAMVAALEAALQNKAPLPAAPLTERIDIPPTLNIDLPPAVNATTSPPTVSESMPDKGPSFVEERGPVRTGGGGTALAIIGGVVAVLCLLGGVSVMVVGLMMGPQVSGEPARTPFPTPDLGNSTPGTQEDDQPDEGGPPVGSFPTLGTPGETNAALSDSSAIWLAEIAEPNVDFDPIMQQGGQTTTELSAVIDRDDSLIVGGGWCSAYLDDNLEVMTLVWSLNDRLLADNMVEEYYEAPYDGENYPCYGTNVVIYGWAPGEYTLIYRVEFEEAVDDGIETNLYPPGRHLFIYTLTVE